jgi:hypothetical protein
MFKNIVIIILGIFSMLCVMNKFPDKVDLMRTTKSQVITILNWGLGYEWNTMTNDQAIQAWNKHHPIYQIKPTDSLKETIKYVAIAYYAEKPE